MVRLKDHPTLILLDFALFNSNRHRPVLLPACGVVGAVGFFVGRNRLRLAETFSRRMVAQDSLVERTDVRYVFVRKTNFGRLKTVF
jgi:hypothetical protein